MKTETFTVMKHAYNEDVGRGKTVHNTNGTLDEH